ncbi:C-type lectin domain family 7 member A-like [Echinops telfairi]|uniref:C-type lectin domain family 7 member A-like n=1 Tax=Echinops telfairi TaxID=9371 RepID=A0ABM1VKR1_ECHTE|nr:C-type lectin domain family 7 member A-like [Echinops telfairi]
MNENSAKPKDVKHLSAKKQIPPKKLQEQVIYSELKIKSSNSKQGKVTRTESSKRKGSSIACSGSPTEVILGLLCFLFLLTTGIFGFMFFQSHQVQKCQLDNTTQEDKYACRNEPITEKPLNTKDEGSTCKPKWSCCGDSCYYFSHELKTFEESRQLCKKMRSTLVKIEDQKEVKFLQSQISYFFWIGLSRKGSSSPWIWEDNSKPSPNIFSSSNWKYSKDGNCGRIATTKMAPSDCSKGSKYICKKSAACFPR